MKTSIHWWSRIVAATTCAMMCTSGLATAQQNQQPPPPPPGPEITCAESAKILRVTTAGDMLLYSHLEPETGALSWAPNPPRIGRSWQTLKPVAAPDGVVYAAAPNGALRRYRWNGTAWDTFPGGVQHQVIEATGWARYTTPEYRNRITVDTDGDIYTVEPDGFLHWRSYDAAQKTWSHQVVHSDFGRFNLIVAAGRGIFYARDGAGALWRFAYHPESQRWVEWPRIIAQGWNTYDRVLSAGADTLYAVQPNGEMFWFRWDVEDDEWVFPQGKRIGAAWIDKSTTAVPSSCRTAYEAPARPEVEPDDEAAPALNFTHAGNVQYTYVNRQGRLVGAQVQKVDATQGLKFATIPGSAPVTGPPSVVEGPQGRLDVVANGWDAEVRRVTQAAPGTPWSKQENHGGFLPEHVAALVPGPHPDGPGPSSTDAQSNPLPAPPALPLGSEIMFGIDDDSVLWVRQQSSPTSTFDAWRPVTDTPFEPGTVSVLDSPRGIRLIGLDTDDDEYWVGTYVGNDVVGWTSLSVGDGFDEAPGATVMDDGTLQVVGSSEGEIYTIREQVNGEFDPDDWENLDIDDDGDFEAWGKPSVIQAENGGLIIATRVYDYDTGEDFVVYTGQVTPGSTSWTEWDEITDGSIEAGSDPTLLTVPDEDTWVVGYRDENDVPMLFRHLGDDDFAQIPLVLPKK